MGPDRNDDGRASQVRTALELGWRMAELYEEVRPDSMTPPHPRPAQPLPHLPASPPERVQLQADLPGVGSLRDRQRLELLVDQVGVGIKRLSEALGDVGLEPPDLSEWDSLGRQRRSAEGRYQLARAVLECHGELLVRLTALDLQFGTSYGLGRALADLCRRPDAAAEKTFTDDFKPGGRVDTLVGWLRELQTVLPDHAAGAVSWSLRQWETWARDPRWEGSSLDWEQHSRQVVGTLQSQGQRWRLVLTGQVAAVDGMAAEDYVDAAAFLVGRVRRIAQRTLVQYWPWITALTVALVFAVVGSLALLHSPAAKGIGVAVSVFGWLGVSSKTFIAGLRQTVGHVEATLWQAELDLAAGRAITALPGVVAQRNLGEDARPADRLIGAVQVRLSRQGGQPRGDAPPGPWRPWASAEHCPRPGCSNEELPRRKALI